MSDDLGSLETRNCKTLYYRTEVSISETISVLHCSDAINGNRKNSWLVYDIGMLAWKPEVREDESANPKHVDLLQYIIGPVVHV